MYEVQYFGPRGSQKPILLFKKSGASGSCKIRYSSYEKPIHLQLKQHCSYNKNSSFRIIRALQLLLYARHSTSIFFVPASFVCSLSSLLDVVCGSHHVWVVA